MKQNLPNEVMKVLSFADSGDRPVCQNPEFASSLLRLVIVSCTSETATGKIVILQWREKFMGMGADGAAVNLGHKGSLSIVTTTLIALCGLPLLS